VKTLLTAVFLVACSAAVPAAAQAPQSSPAPAAQTGQARVDAVREAARTDKRGLVERNMQLTAEEAKRFWPLYGTYQAELDKIVQRQNRAVLDYVNAESSMTDANAKRIAREVLDADADELKLYDRQYRKLLAVLPARKAVRFIQIENKLRSLRHYDIAERIPLVR
jgi:Spy/CpxP family protein refolding chaperone